jgi:hypothetical protein
MPSISRRNLLQTGVTMSASLACAPMNAAPLPEDPFRFPSTELANHARELLERHATPLIQNHSLRSYLFAQAVAEKGGLRAGADYDGELVFLICVLHDIGLTDEANGDQRFEVDGADYAARFLEEHRASDEWVDAVWDGIAMHATPTFRESPVFSQRRRPEINIACTGVGADILGSPGQFPPGYADRVHAAYPRHGGARAITDVIVAQAVGKPSKATPMTFAGEIVHQRIPSAPYTTWDMMLDAGGWGD